MSTIHKVSNIPKVSKLLLVRHGQSEWNSIGKLQGQYDSPLTELGREQAGAIANELTSLCSGQNIKIYSSPLSRAHETATIAAQALGLKQSDVQIDQRLNDYNLGQFSGKFGWRVLQEDYPDLEYLRLNKPLEFQPPDGELGINFEARLRDFIISLPDNDTTTLIVSHGVVNKYIRSILRKLTGDQVIALSEGQDTIYQLDKVSDDYIEKEIQVLNSPDVAPTKKVHVSLGERSYDVVVGTGLLNSLQEHLGELINGKRVAIISDNTVLEKYLDSLKPQLDELTPTWHVYKVPEGEQAKAFSTVETLLHEMLDDDIDRRCVVIAFGGGVVGDVAGLAASLLHRGIEFIQIPTTLMSQVDSAVGGKNGINTRHGKNLVGSFLQPKIVLNDVDTLNSLPLSELRSGYGEILKYALLGGEEQFSWVEQYVDAIIARYAPKMIEAIRMGSEVKANIVSEDELDKGKRAYVNLGHTFAHAFEAHAGYGSFPHGHAVGVGVIAACKLSELLGVCENGLTNRVENHVQAAGMPTSLKDLSAITEWNGVSLHQYMLNDKKTFNGNIHFVLLKGVGQPFSQADVPLEKIYDALRYVGANVNGCTPL